MYAKTLSTLYSTSQDAVFVDLGLILGLLGGYISHPLVAARLTEIPGSSPLVVTLWADFGGFGLELVGFDRSVSVASERGEQRQQAAFGRACRAQC